MNVVRAPMYRFQKGIAVATRLGGCTRYIWRLVWATKVVYPFAPVEDKRLVLV